MRTGNVLRFGSDVATAQQGHPLLRSHTNLTNMDIHIWIAVRHRTKLTRAEQRQLMEIRPALLVVSTGAGGGCQTPARRTRRVAAPSASRNYLRFRVPIAVG